ncbi:hypothetical protein [Prosthecobacter fusiformis]|nr:hypothetical protein [Prosthecobacter fusiformis]
MSQRMSDRMAQSRKRMGDQNDRSVFDKAMQSSITKNKSSGGWMGKKNFKSGQYAGTKSYAGPTSYKTESFSGSKNKSSMASQGFAQAGKTADVADDAFETNTSRYASQSARESNQAFSGSDDVFKTGADRDALRSQRKNDRPKFIELEEHQRTPAYTEQQVRRLLGRQ